MDFRSKPDYNAEAGGAGGKKKMTGKSGDDLEIKVPLGTLIYELRNGDETLVADMVEKDQKLITQCRKKYFDQQID
jgi:GTP-binding protein